jgi:Asp-tRNA(Asn)/Glu-tRNA(Gln) amidotransferase A subunit family amidase
MTVPPSPSTSGSVPRGSPPADLELFFMPATALTAAIRAKKVSPVDVIDAVYARLHAMNARIKTNCTLTEERAHVEAKESETAVMRGDQLGALHGVPVSIKDLLLTQGVRTMHGSRIRENYLAEEDAHSAALEVQDLPFDVRINTSEQKPAGA